MIINKYNPEINTINIESFQMHNNIYIISKIIYKAIIYIYY